MASWTSCMGQSGMEGPIEGHRTKVTRLQMVRYSPRSGHWALVCLLSGVKRTEINGPQNVRF